MCAAELFGTFRCFPQPWGIDYAPIEVPQHPPWARGVPGFNQSGMLTRGRSVGFWCHATGQMIFQELAPNYIQGETMIQRLSIFLLTLAAIVSGVSLVCQAATQPFMTRHTREAVVSGEAKSVGR